MTLRIFPLLAIFTLRTLAAEKRDPFEELVRPTGPLTPEQERAAFHLPPGFEIQLVASEPDLRKPMNMQWDALGRLWITESREYPFPVKDGSSSKGKEMPDFLSTDDPWFRPVDLSWGPDGALYVADFYNKIIGHYEVPLTHPARDRERGRLWRIVWRGEKSGTAAARDASSEAPAFGVRGLDPALAFSAGSTALQKIAAGRTGGVDSARDLQTTPDAPRAESESGVKPPHSKASRHSPTVPAIAVALDASLSNDGQITALIRELASTNLTRRTLALNDLCDVHGTTAVPAIKAAHDADALVRTRMRSSTS